MGAETTLSAAMKADDDGADFGVVEHLVCLLGRVLIDVTSFAPFGLGR